jgi:hypothetical protein
MISGPTVTGGGDHAFSHLLVSHRLTRPDTHVLDER